MPNQVATPAPICIGYCLSLTGPLAANSQSAQLAHELWREDINKRGGLLGRQVEFVRYDDRADATLIPAIYNRLMDEEKVDLVIGGYGTGTLRPSLPSRCGVCCFTGSALPSPRSFRPGAPPDARWVQRGAR